MSDASTTREVALLGLGAMGSRAASRVLDAGVPLRVWNRTPSPVAALAERGARAADDPAQAVSGAAVVLVCVRDDAASAAVWNAATPGLADAVLVDLSTVSPAHARALADRLGPRFLEAPMVGSRPQIEAGQLQLLVGGDAGALTAARPVLDAIAGGVHHVGPVGHAAALKLAVNGLLAAQLAVAGELLSVLRRLGLDVDAAAGLIAALPVSAPALARAMPRILAADTSPNFPLDLAAKDLRYLLADAGRVPVLAAVGAAVDEAAREDGERDVVALALAGGVVAQAAAGSPS